MYNSNLNTKVIDFNWYVSSLIFYKVFLKKVRCFYVIRSLNLPYTILFHDNEISICCLCHRLLVFILALSQVSSHINELCFQQKTARIAPIKEYEEPAIRDGVYNHLNESDKADRSDYYDHAGPAPSMSVTKDGYGVVSMKSESNGDYHTADRQNNGNEQNDNYFTFQED